jgi:phospholipase C
METRRSFLKKAAMLSGTAGVFGTLPASIQRAFAIDPEPGTTFLDAEHVVILMQENRSFDHSYGTLQGVRGYNDPRAVRLPNGNLVWLQSNSKGETYAPFRLDIKETKATWMGSLPHSWADQVDARNGGKYDQWLQSKPSGHREYSQMPLTLGHYTREDIPFYYALADAFTVCDQHFCSSLTGTMPNRLYLWGGTIRGVKDASAPAKVLNSDVEYENSCSWKTFPERLEENGVSWKVYQNELWLDVGFSNGEGPWLSNYGDNPLEWFTQYHARFLSAHQKQVEARVKGLAGEIAELKSKLATNPNDRERDALNKKLERAEKSEAHFKAYREKWSAENFSKLPEREKNLFTKAFTTNTGDPDYHQLAAMEYEEDGEKRKLNIPKGDVLHQFRKDVQDGKLPTVSWIVAPENFSDHPSSAWFGAWYLSEVIDILTANPEVWKKTIFILTYDENDGYFDHVPPFVAPNPRNRETGAVSEGMNIEEEFVSIEEELKRKSRDHARECSIGLGYRVPMVVASPWSRGGYVCSQVFDHTSVLQLLEKFASKKSGRKIEEENISDWRRAVCGDLTSIFRPFNGEKITIPTAVRKKEFFETINNAKFKKLPTTFKSLSQAEIAAINNDPRSAQWMAQQEPGTRPSCPLPYELSVEGRVDRDRGVFVIAFAAGSEQFGEKSAGAAFAVRAPGKYRKQNSADWELGRNWDFAVAAGKSVTYEWPLNAFDGGRYHLRVDGPNGFHREFQGSAEDSVVIQTAPQKSRGKISGDVVIKINNLDKEKTASVVVEHHGYKLPVTQKNILPGKSGEMVINPGSTHGWYDFTIHSSERNGPRYRYAGRIETGVESITDPVMGMA